MLIKTKLRLGTGFLFLVIVLFGVLSLFSINRLKHDSEKLLKNNYESLVYSNGMLYSLDHLDADSNYAVFEKYMKLQQANITETGELDVTENLLSNYKLFRANPGTDSLKRMIRTELYQINNLNEEAILRKNHQAESTARNAFNWLMFIFSALLLITFTITVNFPSVVTRPVAALTQGIKGIVKKDYSQRIHLDQKDEFGTLAAAFNQMAEKLDDYEHSNLAQIKFEKSRIETIINQMKDGIIGLDEKKNILFLNEVAQKLLGLNDAAIAGKYAPDVALENDLMRAVLQEQYPVHEMKIFADNKESYFQLDVLKVNTNEEIIGEVIILRNITPFHELSEAKTNFIATVSHELKTPIAAINISTQLLSDQRIGALNSEQTGLVKSITEDANRLLRITSELLNMSQVETGKIQLHMEAVGCQEIINEAVQSVQYLLQQKNIKLGQQDASSFPQIFADKEKTTWVLVNFLTNAIKHSLPSSNIQLSIEQDKNFVRFLVRDFGKGMEEKYLTRIFDRHYKIPGSSSGSGSGLGLTIAKEFIEAQQGNVWVESMLGVGSTFGFQLPVSI